LSVTNSVNSYAGVEIVYDVEGQATGSNSTLDAIVFIHGWTCNRKHWRNQISEFSDRHRTIAIDLAGHGESGLGRSEYSMPAFARDVASVLEQEHVGRAILVGYSMGGMVILHAARLLGNKVIGLVGVDTFKFLRNDPGSGRQSEQLHVMARDYDSAVQQMVLGMFADDTPDALRESISEGMLATPREVGFGAMKGMSDDEPLFDLATSLKIPKMTINATARELDKAAITDAGVDLRMVATKGHFVMNENPEEFNRLLSEAVESNLQVLNS
jgi:pimeloyl-ACP methyl ester carboxylesterase